MADKQFKSGQTVYVTKEHPTLQNTPTSGRIHSISKNHLVLRTTGGTGLYKVHKDNVSHDSKEDWMSKKYRAEAKEYVAGLPKSYVGDLSTSTAKARKAHWEKMSKYSDRDPRAYEPAPGDATAETKPSKATLAVRKMMKEGSADTSLAAKAEKTGISMSTLKAVYRRGVAAWNSGHRPGTTPEQWGHARVNSYIKKGKGTYHGADKDLREAKDPKEYGFEGEMAMSQLKGILQHAQQLHDMLEPDTDLPEWVQSKITLAYDYIQTATDYMSTEMSEAVDMINKNRTKAMKAGSKLPVDPDTDTPNHFTSAQRRKRGLPEEAPTVSAGSGNVAGIGVGAQGEPGLTPKAMKKYKEKNATEAPKVGRKTFSTFMQGK